jgi:hypothetical protein
MRYLFLSVVAVMAVALASAPAALAQERSTPEQAQALCERAVQHMRDVGPETAIKDFNDPEAGYIVRDLFVIVYDPEGIIRTGVPALRGKQARDITDVTGKELGKEIIDTAFNRDGSWVEYYMTNPATKKVELKTSYVRRFEKYVVFVGVYKS